MQPGEMRQVPPGREAGAALLILAAILAIIAALAIGTRYYGGKTRELSQVQDSAANFLRIQTALYAYAVTNDRFPCPAQAAGAAPGSQPASPGLEVTTGSGAARTCSATATAQIAPWKTLGLAEADVVDPWGHYIAYHVSGILVRDASFSNADKDDNTTWGDLKLGSTATSSDITPYMAYVLISHGKNGAGAYIQSTRLQVADPTSSYELENTDGDEYFVRREFSSTTNTFFDDLVYKGTLF